MNTKQDRPTDFTSATSRARLLCVAVLTAVAASAQAQTRPPASCPQMDTVKVQEYTGYIVNLTTWVAADQGILKKYCIEPRMVPIPSAPAAFAASVQGGVDFIMSSADTAYVPASQGLDIKLVGHINDTVFYSMVVGKHLKLSGDKLRYPNVIKELKGKSIGVNAFGSSMDTQARYAVKGAGVDAGDVKWVAYGAFPNGLAALSNGTLDAIEVSGDAMDIAAAVTGGTIVADFRDKEFIKSLPQVAAMNGANMFWVAPTSFINKNPDLVRRFVAAQNETIAWIKDPKNFDAVVKVIEERAPSPDGVPDRKALTAQRAARYIPQLNPKASRKAMQAWSDLTVSEKRVDQPVNLDKLVWEGAKDMVAP